MEKNIFMHLNLRPFYATCLAYWFILHQNREVYVSERSGNGGAYTFKFQLFSREALEIPLSFFSGLKIRVPWLRLTYYYINYRNYISFCRSCLSIKATRGIKLGKIDSSHFFVTFHHLFNIFSANLQSFCNAVKLCRKKIVASAQFIT